jgi:uncharacterized FlaG/YvyC family protein
MDVTAVNRATGAPVVAAPEIPPEKAAENRAVVQAVKAMNGTEMFGQDNRLTYQRDPDSQRIVIQVINQTTHEVVSQIPPEYVLRMAEDLKRQQAVAQLAAAQTASRA